MGIFDRISRLVKSNVNAAGDAIGSLQDTGKEVEQLVLEMEAALRRARTETTEAMAGEKLAHGRLEAAEREVATWDERAASAVRADDEALAREALHRAEEKRALAGALRHEEAEARATALACRDALLRLEERLREVKARKGTIQAKLALGRQNDLSSGALDDFQRMSDRIDDSEAAGEAEGELERVLSSDPKRAEVEARLARLGDGSVESRLAALKKKVEER